MTSKKDHITQQEEYQRYLENKMSSKERHAFELKMLEDDFEGEALEGLSELTPDELQKDLRTLKSNLYQKTRKRSSMVYRRVAAAILLLGVFSFMIYSILDNKSNTEVAQSKSASDTQLDEADNEILVDSVPITQQEEPEPIVAYNQKLDEEEITEEVISKPETSEEISAASNNQELLAMEGKATQEEFKKMEIGKKLEPEDLPEPVFEPQAEILDETVTIQEVEPTPSEERYAPSAVWKEEFDKEMNMRRSKAREAAPNTRTITGRIMSVEDDEGLPGVNVTVKGSASGTVSDIEGNYTINVPEDEEVTLVYSSVGYNSEEVQVAEDSEVNVNIEPDITALSEIVVVGYGTEQDAEETEYSFTPPRPEGGQSAFRNYVKEYMRYPGSGLEEGIKGTVKLRFSVGINGEITNMEVLKSLGDDFDKEAIRLVNEGPAWQPAELNGEIVEREVKVKIRFRVPE